MRSRAALVAAALLAACASTGAQPSAAPVAPKNAWIVNAQGASIGQAHFQETPHGVLIKLEFSEGALPPGWHGAHLHMNGDCADPAAGFQASGAHVGHGGPRAHGLDNAAGAEPGDLPNLYAAAAGPFGAEFFNDRVTLGLREDRARLLDADGSALVIHAAPDDHQSQPIGGAGPRLACAALTPTP